MTATTAAALQSLSAHEWDRERIGRVDAIAAALSNVNAAIAFLPRGGHHDTVDTLARVAATLRADLRLAVNQTNPFTKETQSS